MDNKINNTSIKLCTIGAFGGLILFFGDMLFYGDFQSGREYFDSYVQIMGKKSEAILTFAAIIGFTGSIFEAIGIFIFYYTLKIKQKLIAKVGYFCLALMSLFGGIFHFLYAFIGFYSNSYQSEVTNSLFNDLNTLMIPIKYVMLISGTIGSIIFIFYILINKSRFPKWIILIFPTILSLFHPLTKYLGAPLGGIIAAGYINLSFVLFFTVSVILFSNSNRYVRKIV